MIGLSTKLSKIPSGGATVLITKGVFVVAPWGKVMRLPRRNTGCSDRRRRYIKIVDNHVVELRGVNKLR